MIFYSDCISLVTPLIVSASICVGCFLGVLLSSGYVNPNSQNASGNIIRIMHEV